MTMDIVRVRVGTAWSERLTTLTVLRSGTRAARTLEAVRCFALKGLARERMGHPRAAHPHAISHVPPDLGVIKVGISQVCGEHVCEAQRRPTADRELA